ncbi:MAG: asparagine synthase (glutamine-hydrolyzing) [Eubacteriaceae bacterium]
MCGIVGWINTNEDISSYSIIINNMMNTLRFRGPDSYGTYIHRNVLLGHRRLIVIDPEGGQQPMTKVIGCNKYTVIYNGELYNTEELRDRLSLKGYTFDSYSDTEVLLTSYIEWKEDCVKHLNGIFAFCVWDENNRSIFLARDQLGVKPLFYTTLGSSLLFASELKALLAHPDIEASIDKEGLLEIFGLGPATNLGSGVFKNIHEIPPANYLTYKYGDLKIKEYWQLEALEHKESLNETVEHTKSLVIDAVKRQLISDVPLCTFLSGGLDSSIISTVASNNMDSLKTFSVDYSDNDKYFKSSLYQPNSDSLYINEMVDFINSSHLNIILTQEDLAATLYDSMKAKDIPGMADVDSSLYLFCKEIKKYATVALSGECADEIFGGYPWYTRKEDLYSNTFPWAKSINYRLNVLNKDLKKLPLEEYVADKFNNTLSKVPKLDGESELDQKIRNMFYLNIKWFMITLLNRKDRMSMRNSLEVRVPFADHRLVEYAFNIPAKYKLLNNREKGLLRESFKDYLPATIVNRKKSPYPKTHNPLYTELVKNKMKNILNNNSSPILDIIDIEYVNNIIETSGSIFKAPWYGQLMTGPQIIAFLIQVNYWLENYRVKII